MLKEPVFATAQVIYLSTNEAVAQLVESDVYKHFPIMLYGYRKDFIPGTESETAQIVIGRIVSFDVTEEGTPTMTFEMQPNYEEAFRKLVLPLVRVLSFVNRETNEATIKRFLLTTKERNDAAIAAANARKQQNRPQRPNNRGGNRNAGGRKPFNGVKKNFNR